MTEQVRYEVERIVDGVEVRRDPALILATVREMRDDDAFGILFRYISGDNRSPRRNQGERIPMTAPVLSQRGSFSFAIPASYSIETAPRPVDPRSVLEQIPDRRVAVLRFSGLALPEDIAAKGARLVDLLARNELCWVGQPFLMRYNPPFTPGFMRRNEIGVELAPTARRTHSLAA